MAIVQFLDKQIDTTRLKLLLGASVVLKPSDYPIQYTTVDWVLEHNTKVFVEHAGEYYLIAAPEDLSLSKGVRLLPKMQLKKARHEVVADVSRVDHSERYHTPYTQRREYDRRDSRPYSDRPSYRKSYSR